jgi:hypothetical protein
LLFRSVFRSMMLVRVCTVQQAGRNEHRRRSDWRQISNPIGTCTSSIGRQINHLRFNC